MTSLIISPIVRHSLIKAELPGEGLPDQRGEGMDAAALKVHFVKSIS